jgi:hypothetical protein
VVFDWINAGIGLKVTTSTTTTTAVRRTFTAATGTTTTRTTRTKKDGWWLKSNPGAPDPDSAAGIEFAKDYVYVGVA